MRLATHVLAGMLCCSTAVLAAAHLPSAPRVPYEPGEILVAMAPGASLAQAPDGSARAGSVALAATLARFGLGHATVLSAETATGQGEIVRLKSALAGFDPVAAAAAMRALPGVVGASPNVHLQLNLVPTDPYLPYQWHLGTSAAAIHAQQGWDRQTGSPNVVVAIIDTGVDLTHADLYQNIWTNPGEVDGNGIDDDHDGYADDVHGWDFGDNDNDPDPDPMIDPSYGIDEGWHGTFVAGLAAGVGNNGIGISGVAMNCKIMPLKISDSYGNLLLSSAVSAIAYAAAHHVAALNMSFGTTDPTAQYIFQPAVTAATAAGVVCVASAGNSGTDTPQYPAACDSVIAVASTNDANVRSSWSNWGWYVDMAAPGEGMWSTIARNYQYDDYSLAAFEQWWGFDGMHAYMENDGTSFAAPLVTGAVGLMRSQFPTLTAKQVLKFIVAAGEVKAYDDPIGPKLDLDHTLISPLAVGPDDGVAGALAFAAPQPNPAVARTTLRFTLPQAGRARLSLYDASGRRVAVLADGAQGAGTHALAWDLRDEAGRTVSPGLYFAHLETPAGSRTQRVVVMP